MRPLPAAIVFALVLFCQAPAAGQEILIGLAGPMSGPFAVFGKQMKAGAELAVNQINANGGVHQRKVRLIIEDTKCEGDRAGSVANRMVGKEVAVVIGHFCSRSSISAAPIYAQNKIVQISPASPNPHFTSQRPNPAGGTYRLGPKSDAEALAIARHLEQLPRQQSIGLLHDGSAYGKGLVEAVRSAFSDKRRKFALVDEFRPGQKSYKRLIAKLHDSAVDVVFIGGYHADIGLIARQAKARGYDLQIIAGDPILTDDFAEVAKEGAVGVVAIAPPDPVMSKAAQELVAKLDAEGTDPDGYVLPTFAALQIWAAAGATSLDYLAVIQALNTQTFKTVLGEVSFDKQGNASLPDFIAYQWTENGYRPVN